MSGSTRLALAQALAHCSILPMLYFGSWHHYLISIALYFSMGCFGMSITYHRLLSHRSFRTHKIFECIGSFLGTIGLVGSTLSWVAIHRQHHQHTDKELDPHSPHSKSFLNAHLFSMFPKPNLQYVKDLVKSPTHRFFHRRYWLINASYVSLLIVLDPFAAIYGYLFPSFLLWHGGSLINTLGHLKGYRNFNTADSSMNNRWLSYLTWGEGLHNNHHRRPSKYSFKVLDDEHDISAWFIDRIRYKKIA